MVLKQSNIFELIQDYKCNKFLEYIRIANHEIKMYIQKFFEITKPFMNNFLDVNI